MIRLKRFVSKSWFIYLVLFLAPMVVQLAHHHHEKHSNSSTFNHNEKTYNEVCLVCDYQILPATEVSGLTAYFESEKLFLVYQTSVLQSKASESPLFQLRAPPFYL